jgi:LysM repeat protein
MIRVQQVPRIPVSCPAGFLGRYTVQPGDTFFNIARMFRVRLEALAVNNPHISNPNFIFPGDVLCVPGLISYPCCAVLSPAVRVPFGTGGTALINFAPQGGQSVSITATLPQPQIFGNFDIYLGEILIPDIGGGFGNQLFPTPQDPPNWSTRIDIPTVAQITPNSTLVVRPSNSITGASGPVILEGTVCGVNC